MKYVPEEAQVMTSYVANQALFHFVTDVLGIAVGTTLKWDPTSITLAQIKKKIEDIQKDLNALLNADFEAALRWLTKVATYLKHQQFKLAYENIQEVQRLSIRAYSQVKTFREKVFCMKMSVYSMRMIQTYNETEQIFVDFLSLSEKAQKALAENVFAEVNIIVNEFEKIEEPNWFQRKLTKSKKKSEEQDYLDDLLKTAMPIMWNHIDIFNDDIPDGFEDACEIKHKGELSLRIWKDSDELYVSPLSITERIKAFDSKILKTKIKIIATINFMKLPQEEQKFLAKRIKVEVDNILEEFEKMKYEAQKKVEHNLNGLLQVALPIMFHHIDLFKDRQFTDKDMTKYLPHGKNASEFVLEGKWPIKVCKDVDLWLWFEFQDDNAIDNEILSTKYKSISSFCKYQSMRIFFSSSFLW